MSSLNSTRKLKALSPSCSPGAPVKLAVSGSRDDSCSPIVILRLRACSAVLIAAAKPAASVVDLSRSLSATNAVGSGFSLGSPSLRRRAVISTSPMSVSAENDLSSSAAAASPITVLCSYCSVSSPRRFSRCALHQA